MQWSDEEQLRFELGFILQQSRALKKKHPGDEPHKHVAERIIAELRARGYRIECPKREYRRQDHP